MLTCVGDMVKEQLSVTVGMCSPTATRSASGIRGAPRESSGPGSSRGEQDRAGELLGVAGGEGVQSASRKRTWPRFSSSPWLRFVERPGAGGEASLSLASP